jgi:hypothetical protein
LSVQQEKQRRGFALATTQKREKLLLGRLQTDRDGSLCVKGIFMGLP